MSESNKDFDLKHRVLLQCIQSPIVALISDFSILFCNDSFAELLDKNTAEGIEGSNLLEISSEFENSLLYTLISDVFDNKKAKSLEVPFTDRHYNSDIYPTPWGIIAILSDITEKKRINSELKKSKRRFETLINAADDVIIQTDLEGKHIYRNKAYYSSLGFEDIDNIDLDRYSRIHPDDAPRLKISDTILMEKGKSSVEYRVKNKKGQWVNRYAKSVVLYENDKPVSILSIIRDVSELKRIENELQESESRFRSLIEQYPAGIVVHEKNGNVIFGNQAARKLWGISQEHYEYILGNYNILDDEQLEKKGLMPFIKRGFAGENISLPSIFFNPNNPDIHEFEGTKKLWVQSQLFPINDERGDVTEVVHILNDISEQKSIEVILRKERDTAQRYLDIIPVIMLALNKNQEVTLINRMGCETLGYSEHEILGKNWFDSFLPSRYREKVRTVFRNLLEGRISQKDRFENPIMTKEGEVREISWFNTMLTDEKGVIIGTLSSGEDITERKQAEEALKKSEENYRRLVSTSPEGIWVTDKEDITTFVNPALEKMLGYTKNEMLGHHVKDFLDTNSLTTFTAVSKERFSEQIDSSSYELTFICKDGIPLIARVSGRLIFDNKNEILGSFAIVSDITAKKKAEDFLLQARDYLSDQIDKRTHDLKKEKLRIEAIVETIPTGIVVIDSKMKFILINKKFHEFYQKIYQSKLPKFLNEVLILKNKFGDTISKIFYSKKDINTTIEPVKGFHLELASSKVISQPNTHIGVVIVVRDVTPFVELNNLRKQFVSTVSHELRTPITGISLSLQNLQRYWDKFSELEKKSLIETMSFSSDVLTQMVEDLLIVSRIEAGKFNLNWQNVKLRKTVKEVLIQMDSKRSEREISLSCNIASNIEFLGDGKRLSQVFRILLDNAFKYSKRHSKVRIEALDHYYGEYNPKNEDGILIQVIDSGKGIPEKDIPFIFDRYFRSDDIIDVPGSGVGLDIAKTIIESHHGEIQVESDYGYGTVFSIFLPRILNVKEVLDK